MDALSNRDQDTAPPAWDEFELLALAAGVEPHLAALAREVMRDVVQRGLDPSITLGAPADAPLLLDLLLKVPTSAEYRLLSDQISRAGLERFAEGAAVDGMAARRGLKAADIDDMLLAERDAMQQVFQRH